jgi:hypothetical protein
MIGLEDIAYSLMGRGTGTDLQLIGQSTSGHEHIVAANVLAPFARWSMTSFSRNDKILCNKFVAATSYPASCSSDPLGMYRPATGWHCVKTRA